MLHRHISPVVTVHGRSVGSISASDVLKRSCEGTCVLWQPHDISRENGTRRTNKKFTYRFELPVKTSSKWKENKTVGGYPAAALFSTVSDLATDTYATDYFNESTSQTICFAPLPPNCSLLLNFTDILSIEKTSVIAIQENELYTETESIIQFYLVCQFKDANVLKISNKR